MPLMPLTLCLSLAALAAAGLAARAVARLRADHARLADLVERIGGLQVEQGGFLRSLAEPGPDPDHEGTMDPLDGALHFRVVGGDMPRGDAR